MRPYLRNQDVKWWDINTDDLAMMNFPPSDQRKYELREGDILVCEGGEAGRCAILESDKDCFFQMALHRVRPRYEDYDPRYFAHFMEFAKKSGILSADANRATIEHLSTEKLSEQTITIPPADEQEKIADLLDNNRRKAEKLTEQLSKLSSEVEELLNNRIYQSVTTGVYNDANLTQSGVGWIGEVPEHWEVVRTRFIARLESGHTPSRSNDEYWEDTDIPWVTTSDIKPFRDGRKVYLDETENQISQLGLENSGARLLPEGTVFLSRTASVGFSGIMGKEMATSQDFANWVCGDEILPEYLLYVFRSMDQEFDRLTQGSTHQTIYMPDIRSFKTPLPPLEEQREIVNHIEHERERLWELINKVGQTIDLLEEKRQALITAAVTGQIDVQESRGDEIESTL